MATEMGISSFNVVKEAKDRFLKRHISVTDRHLAGNKQLAINVDRLVPLLSELR